MDSSSTTTPDKHGSETSQSVNSTLQKPDPATVCSREKRRRDHNDVEKKRKEQIKACICKMGDLLPSTYITSERHSTLEIVEKSLNYMRELKEARTKFTVIEDALNQELNALKAERDKYSDIIRAAGLSTESIPTNGVSSTTDVKDDSPKPKCKTKKRQTLGSQLQQLHEQKEKYNQQQEMISSSVSVSEDSSGNIPPNQLMNMHPAGAFLHGQNVMYNPMMNQYMLPGMVANGNQMMPMGMVNTGTGAPNVNAMVGQNIQNTNSQTDLTPNNVIMGKEGDDSDAGLLQLAMQDAGITPGSHSGQQSSSALTPSVTDSGQEAESSSTNALQTLASIATSDQNITTDNNTSMEIQNITNSGPGAMSANNNNNMSVMTSAQSGLQPMLQNGNGTLINMPMLGNQSVLPGQQQQQQQQQQQMQQIMFFNEQGIPMIANVPVGIDPNNPGMFSNSQKPTIVSGMNQQTVIKDQSGNIDQNTLALAQQANIAALQNQLLGQGTGASIPNIPFQQQNMLQGNIIQTPNGQLLQQIGPQINGQGQIIGMQGQGQGIVVAGQQGQLPVSQNGNFLTLNTTPSQPNQLPSALILPNGQIIPVVTNPGSVVSQPNQAQMTQPRMSAPHIHTGLDGQMLSGSNSQGLLIPAAAASTGQVLSSSTAATLSTNVVPTSAIQSVMTTQIQGSSVQSQKPLSASTVASSNQTKLINSSGIAQQGAKPTGTPILLSLPVNGQPTTVLLDPVTMQVYGTVQPGQQTTSQQGLNNVIMASTSSVTPSVSQSSSTIAGSKSKSKNNANQRAICPKPLGGDGQKSTSTPSKKKRPAQKSSTKSKETAPADSLSDSLQIQIPESTTDPEISSAVSSESTDILAKAAESIFSPPTGEMPSVTTAGFYNPANEDNPLHIDTSATEVDDESKSPNKRTTKLTTETVTVNTTKSLQDNVLGINSVGDTIKSVTVNKVVTTNEKSEKSTADNVTSLSATFEEIAGIKFSENEQTLSTDKTGIFANEPSKTNKKSKSSSGKNVENKKSDSKTNVKSNSTKNSKSKKVTAVKDNPVLELDKTDSDSQMDIESTLIHIPENITFNENDLSDVLDQVEQLGTSVSENLNNTKVNKKSKSKRSKGPDVESEPHSKKRKSGKEGKEPAKNTMQSKEILSMPATLSVYDFDDTDDVPLILPLNGKNFTTPRSSTPSQNEFAQNESEESFGGKSDSKSKVSAQNKSKKTSKSAKNSKDSENNSQKVGNDVNSNDSLFDMKELTSPGKRSFGGTEKENLSDTCQNKSSLPSMPEIDTTTSIFGVPIPPKKMPRSDLVQTQNNQKPLSQLSPKLNIQPSTTEVTMSPKDNIMSPNSASMVSPRQNSFTSELVSPKLSIVSPSQAVMADEDLMRSSPKQYTEMSPLKKRSPAEKQDKMKVNSYSALNTVPLSDASTDSFMSLDNNMENNKTISSIGNNQSMSVITSAKSISPAQQDTKKLTCETKLPEDTNQMKKKVSDNLVNTPNSSGLVSHSSNSRVSGSNMDKKFVNPNVVVSSSNSMIVSAQRTQNSINSSQNNRYGNQYPSDQNFGPLPIPPKDTVPRSSNAMNNYSVPCSADTMFNSQTEKVIKSPPNVNISTLNQKPDTSNMSKLRNNNNNAYSVDNFVQSSRDDGIRTRPDSLVSHSDLISSAELGNPSSDFSRLQSESSPDGFNFANIGLNLQPITSNIPSSYMENSSSVSSNMSSSFSFSLSSTSSTVTTSASGLGHHQFPFFPSVLSSASSVPASQTSLPASLPNMDLYDQNNTNNNVIQRNNTAMHSSGSNLSRVDSNTMTRGDNMQQHTDKTSIIADDTNRDQGSKPSCSKQKMNKSQGPATIQEPFSSFPNSSSGTDGNFFHDNQMKSNVGKTTSDQMRKSSQDKMMDMSSSHSRSSQPSMSDKRNNTMDRSPQMMNNSQSYYPSNYPSSKSLNTPPLHHPVMMPPDDRSRNMTNRSPYDNPFPPPTASQGFNSMTGSYPGRFDNGPPSFSRDNSGTQPLSHTPVNSSGRKSANTPSQSSVVKPPQKQSAPPLVPMGGPQAPPPSQGPRQSNQQSHRATTPHGNQQGPSATASGVSRQQKQQSRNKPQSSSKKSKTLPFMEVDSNLSNSIFEPNRSMTPFFPMQNLSPQSRMQHEGSPFLPGNIFGPGPRFPNSSTPMPKTNDFSGPYLFPRGAQNGLGLNFQPGFGMNMNPLHGNHGNGPQLTPHTAPHMANFSLNNIITDGAPQNESSLNISPIKFPHANSMLQHQGMDHNAMQHHHQYNRGHPSVMSINSILGPNHHGFDGRMNTSMAGPFHSHGHPSFIPPLNFSMHDH
ncbi:hypothetical protein ACF0H5_012435 [Mactra antiquata]